MELVVPDAVILPVRLCLLCKETVGGLPEVRRSENLQVLRLPQVGVVASSCPWTVRRAVRRDDCEGPQVSPPLEKIFCRFKVNEVLARRDVGRGPGDREIFLN